MGCAKRCHLGARAAGFRKVVQVWVSRQRGPAVMGFLCQPFEALTVVEVLFRAHGTAAHGCIAARASKFQYAQTTIPSVV